MREKNDGDGSLPLMFRPWLSILCVLKGSKVCKIPLPQCRWYHWETLAMMVIAGPWSAKKPLPGNQMPWGIQTHATRCNMKLHESPRLVLKAATNASFLHLLLVETYLTEVSIITINHNCAALSWLDSPDCFQDADASIRMLEWNS